jgi:hypothetical protein
LLEQLGVQSNSQSAPTVKTVPAVEVDVVERK